MKITITCYARFRDLFGESVQMDLPESATIHDAIVRLATSAGADGELLVGEQGAVKDYVMIMHQGVRILPVDTRSILLNDGDALILFPPVSGG